MVPDYISFSNVMKYRRKVELDLTGLRVVGIAGANESGKSTILDVLAYNGFGRTARDGLREVDLIADPGTGDLVTQVKWRFPDSSILEIERGRTRKNEPILNVAGLQTRNPTEAEEAIARKVRMTFADFRQLTYFAQGQVHAFMEGDKREALSRWTQGLAVWSALEVGARGRLDRVEGKLSAAGARANRLEEMMEQQTQYATRQRQAEAAAIAAENELQRLQIKLDGLTEAAVTARARRARGVESASKVEDAVDNARQMEREAANAKGRLEGKRLDLKKVAAGRCPMLGIACGALKEARVNEVANAEEAVRRAEVTSIRMVEQRDALLAEVEALRRSASNVKGLSKREDEIIAKYADLVRWRAEVTKNMHAAARELAEAVVARQEAESAGEALEDAQVEVSALEAEAARWQFLRAMCGKAGVPSQIIDGELALVQAKCNWVLSKLGADKEVVFRGYKELAGYERSCPYCAAEAWHGGKCRDCGKPRPHKRREDLTVTVVEGGRERPFASQSGGAKVLVSFAVRFAAALFYSSVAGIPMRFASIDELFGMLDPERRRAMMRLVVGGMSTEFGLERQVVVSHHEDVVGSIDNLLLVRSTPAGSVVDWA